MTAIVTGSDGWLGSAVLKNLEKLNHSPIGCGRHETNSSKYLHADLSQSNLAEKLAETYRHQRIKADLLIHCAGLAHQANESGAVQQQFQQVNVNGTQEIVDFCKNVGIKKILYVGSIAAYEWGNRAMSEDDPTNPTTEYARTKLEGERIVTESGLDWRTVRLATVFGTGDSANFLKLAAALRARRFILPGQGIARKSLIPIDVAADLITRFAIIEAPKHRSINLALPEAPSLKEICYAFNEFCQFPTPLQLPRPILRLLGTAGDVINKIRPFPLSSSTLRKLTTSTWVDTKRMEEVFPQKEFRSFSHYLQQHSSYYKSKTS